MIPLFPVGVSPLHASPVAVLSCTVPSLLGASLGAAFAADAIARGNFVMPAGWQSASAQAISHRVPESIDVTSTSTDAGSYVFPQEWLSAEAQDTLGRNGVTRFEAFRKFKRGWNGPSSQPLSSGSIGSLDAFLSTVGELPLQPSIFLHDDGNLMLGWEGAKGESIEVTMLADGWIFSIGGDDGDIEFRTPISSRAVAAVKPYII